MTPLLSLENATPERLVQTLANPNLLWRTQAQRLLVERGKLDVVPALINLARDPQVDEIGLNVGAIAGCGSQRSPQRAGTPWDSSPSRQGTTPVARWKNC